MHFSGTIVQGDGQLSVTFDELLKAMVVYSLISPYQNVQESTSL